MTSQLVPSDSASAAACSSVDDHRAVADERDVGAAADDPARVQRQCAAPTCRPRPSCQYWLFGSKKITGSREAIASWIIQ